MTLSVIMHWFHVIECSQSILVRALFDSFIVFSPLTPWSTSQYIWQEDSPRWYQCLESCFRCHTLPPHQRGDNRGEWRKGVILVRLVLLTLCCMEEALVLYLHYPYEIFLHNGLFLYSLCIHCMSVGCSRVIEGIWRSDRHGCILESWR